MLLKHRYRLPKIIPKVHEDTLNQHQLIVRGLSELKLVEEKLKDPRYDLANSLDVFKHAAKQSNHA